MARREGALTQKRLTWGLLTVLAAAVVCLVVLLLVGNNYAVLNPAGTIAQRERGLMIFAALLSLFVVMPVFIMTAVIVWKYREGRPEALKKYAPKSDHNRLAEGLWWGIPTILILILSVVAWRSAHALDPYQPLTADGRGLTVQVVALDWKWLFIYPDEHIATVNDLHIPVGVPVNFQITSDAPMNSFWIPQLGGQVYAMSGMSTQLHLMASRPGMYRGSSANLSGEGFADMNFNATAMPPASFYEWVQQAQRSRQTLDTIRYEQLAKPSRSNAPATYTLPSGDLYNTVMAKYMRPTTAVGGHSH